MQNLGLILFKNHKLCNLAQKGCTWVLGLVFSYPHRPQCSRFWSIFFSTFSFFFTIKPEIEIRKLKKNSSNGRSHSQTFWRPFYEPLIKTIGWRVEGYIFSQTGRPHLSLHIGPGVKGPTAQGARGPGGPGPWGRGAREPGVMVTGAYSHYLQNCPLSRSSVPLLPITWRAAWAYPCSK